MEKKTILIIEDEEVLLDVLTKKLVKEGFEVLTAINGEEGLRQARTRKPDLILLDILMPRLNGYEVLEELKRDGITLPIIIISNSGQPVEIDRAKKLGACDFIVKAEFTPDEVSAKVRKYLSATQVAAPDVGHDRGKGVKVLVIEDDQFLRDLLKTKLEREQFEVSAAIDGPEGLERIEQGMPDLILLDIILPGIDGFEILKRIKSSGKLSRIPIVLLSNLGQEADVEKGKALGASDYLIKSNFTIDEIVDKIRALLKH
ncbi:MAG TPA: hypothetical protein DIS62_00410 [Candidatus Kerfeldbacteria bacterium]|nr:MAG: Two component system histidine kinase [Parcubacteria group bacterium GW2011_GWA2_48_9]KKW15856.1 MAG: Two component system histidine kinase [Parcubacteria group bacterium GW2011_GWC2_49_9]HCM67457.1 hypothetical protein [Candidatus Kerfeldbacteria bacterium]